MIVIWVEKDGERKKFYNLFFCPIKRSRIPDIFLGSKKEVNMGQKRGGIEFFSTNAKCVQYKSRLDQKKKVTVKEIT